ncbi:putative tRNA pseudouridine synthase Pus10 [Smittium culicis]|uniref:tRNA pseudouridine(55) synthase n=1 Tax=Smittium culicis TaxID=133412 RepID=A0A1R1XRD9_9FUNG|nr:putative tRNA pseudouridine synthase Pus10 [Smittium culicis]
MGKDYVDIKNIFRYFVFNYFNPNSSYFRKDERKVTHVKETKDYVKKALDIATFTDFQEAGFYPPTKVTLPSIISQLLIRRDPIFIGGRYMKLLRGVSQTPFFVGDLKLAENSVSELIAGPISTILKPEGHNFVGSGREDADVRMLGTGRPFYIEFKECIAETISPEQLSIIQNEINTNNPFVRATHLKLLQK